MGYLSCIIDDELQNKMRIIALRKNILMPAMISEMLTEYVNNYEKDNII